MTNMAKTKSEESRDFCCLEEEKMLKFGLKNLAAEIANLSNFACYRNCKKASVSFIRKMFNS